MAEAAELQLAISGEMKVLVFVCKLGLLYALPGLASLLYRSGSSGQLLCSVQVDCTTYGRSEFLRLAVMRLIAITEFHHPFCPVFQNGIGI
jgi:hypothetical protein